MKQIRNLPEKGIKIMIIKFRTIHEQGKNLKKKEKKRQKIQGSTKQKPQSWRMQ